MIGFDMLIAQIGGLDRSDLERWVANKWVLPQEEFGRYVFGDIDVARVHLIYELREEMDVDELALPVVLSLLDQLYDLRRQMRAIGEAMSQVGSQEMLHALAEHLK
jgi:chaperone modulatory protein CbpM